MNYRHIYHAGNFADVFKHVLLVTLIQALSRKEKPFCYFETHAGIGLYDLQAMHAQKTQEFAEGIGQLWTQPNSNCSAGLTQYLNLVRLSNPEGELRYYPGSPWLARHLLRREDRMILCELHPADILSLQERFPHDPQIATHHLDGYVGLKSLLPPPIKRGLVFIDPPFEKVDEFSHLAAALPKALQRWSTASYVIWYPIKNRSAVKQFYRALQASGIREILACEFSISGSLSLTSCGMLCIQPPWQWEIAANAALTDLTAQLAGSAARFRAWWVVPE